MEIDVAFVGEATGAQLSVHNLDEALKGLAKSAELTSHALAQIELPASNVASSVLGMKTMERGLNSLENQAQRTKRQLAEVSILNWGMPTIGGAGGGSGSVRQFVGGPGGASVSSSWTEFSRVVAQANMWAQRQQQNERNAARNMLADWAAANRRRSVGTLGSHDLGAFSGGPSGVKAIFPFGPDREGRDAGRKFWGGFFRSMTPGGAGVGGGGGGRRGRGGDWRDVTIGESLGALVPGGSRARGPVLGVGIGALTAIASPVGNAALGLLAAIPALAIAGAGALGTLMLAFHGLGKAIDGDKKAFDKLDPQAQKFVQTIRGMIPWVHSLGKIARDELAPALTKAFHEALTPTTVGAIEKNVRGMAAALGVAAQQWGKFLGSGSTGNMFVEIFQHAFVWIQQLNDAMIHLSDAFLHLAQAALPLDDWLVKGIDKGSKLLDVWVKQKQASGEMARAFASMRQDIMLVGNVLHSFIDLVVSLLRALHPAGVLILTNFAKGMSFLADEIDRNRAKISTFVTGALTALFQMIGNIWHLLTPIVGAIDSVVTALGGWKLASQFILTGLLFKQIFAIVNLLATQLVRAWQAVTVAEIAAGDAGKALTVAGGPWAVLIATALTILLYWKQIRKLIDGVDTSKALPANYPAGYPNASEQKSVDPIIKDITRLRKSGASDAQIKAQLGKKYGELQVSDAFYWMKQGYVPGAVTDDRPRAYVAQAGPHKGKIVYRNQNGQEVLAKPGTRVGTILPGSTPTGARGTQAALNPVSGGGKIIGTPGAGTHSRTEGAGPGGYLWQDDDAVDIAMKPGAAVVAVEAGTIGNDVRYGGDAGRFSGWGFQLNGHSGRQYYYKHLKSVTIKNGQSVKRGQILGYGTTTGHLHFALKGATTTAQVLGAGQIVSVPGKPQAPRSTSNPFGTPPPFDKNLGPATTIASAASRSNAALAALKDLQKAHALAKQIAQLAPHSVTHTVEGVTLTDTVGGSLTKQEQALKKQIAVWEAQLAAHRKFLLTHKHLTTQQVANIRAADAQIANAIAQGKAKIVAAIQATKEEFLSAWADLTDRALEQFDAQRAAHKTPTELLIEQLTDARTQRDLQDAVDQARKNLDDALAGVGSNAAQATLDRITEVIGRFGLAMAIDKAQAKILGGPTMDFGRDFLQQLQEAAVPGANGKVDPEAIKQAQKDLEDALLNQKLFYLGKTADAERTAYDQETVRLRKALADQLKEWGAYWAGVGANAKQAWALFDQVWVALTGQHLPPLPGAGSTGSTGGSTGAAAGGGNPFSMTAGEANARGLPTPNPGAAGAAAVTAASGGGVALTNRIGSIWDVNQPNRTSAINSAATGGGSITITEGDPNGPSKAIDAASRGVPYSIQVNGDANDTPETLAAKINAAKAAYPGAASITLDLESTNFRGGPGSPGWIANQGFAAAANAAAGNIPLVISTEAVSDFNYGAYATNPKTTFAPQAYWGNMDPRDISTVVSILTAAGIDPSRIVPIIGPNQSVGSYGGPVSVYGSPAGGTALSGAAPGGLTPAQAQSVAAVANQIQAGGTTITPSIAQAIVAAATTTEAPTEMFTGTNGIKFMAEGGILTKPTLMMAGERGHEAVIPLGSARGKNLLGGDAEPIDIHINVGEGMEWLADYIEVHAVKSSGEIGRVQGAEADRRIREGRR